VSNKGARLKIEAAATKPPLQYRRPISGFGICRCSGRLVFRRAPFAQSCRKTFTSKEVSYTNPDVARRLRYVAAQSHKGKRHALVNGKFYANLLYGRALERARAADSGQLFAEENPEQDQSDTQEISYRNPEQSRAKPPAPAHGKHSGSDRYDAATTPEGVANQVYNETSGLRPTDKNGTGPGSDWDMQQGRKAMAHVIQNRAKGGTRGGLAALHIQSTGDARDIKIIGTPAYDAHGESVYAAHRASKQPDPAGGAKYFYLDRGQTPPPWTFRAIS